MQDDGKARRGRRPGSKTGARKGSWNSYLLTMEPGERRYLETDSASYANMMRTVIAPKSRRPPELAGREFKSTLYTAISAANCTDVRYLVAVDRVE